MLMYKKKETINEARYLWWMSVDSPYNHRRSLLHVGGLYHCETIYKPKLRGYLMTMRKQMDILSIVLM
jgi:hypothetical protein